MCFIYINAGATLAFSKTCEDYTMCFIKKEMSFSHDESTSGIFFYPDEMKTNLLIRSKYVYICLQNRLSFKFR